MKSTQYDKYGELAKERGQSTLQNGRYASQKIAEKQLVSDVVEKLNIGVTDSVLDVGCGAGNLLIPLSYMTENIVGIDHPSVINLLSERFHGENLSLIPGNFLELNISNKYDKILAYSVLHTLSDKDIAFTFVKKLLEVMQPDGICLLGDIPNTDKKRRFLQSERGKKFQKQWEASQMIAAQDDHMDKLRVEQSLTTDDRFFIELNLLLRSLGCETSWLSQKSHLPFGNTREDIIIYGPEYER